jgi:RNA polymerase sigma-70 factor (ECF subfamily)
MLVRMHHTRGVRAADLIVLDTALAEDVVQSAFVRAYERIGQFDLHRPFGPWFMRVVVNDAVKAVSRHERKVSLVERDAEDLLARLVDPSVGPHEMAEEAETRRRVWHAMEELPPTQRAVIVQRYYLGMSEAEMAQIGGSPPGTIKSRLNAARKRLSRLLRPHLRTQSTPTLIDTLSDPSERRDDRD